MYRNITPVVKNIIIINALFFLSAAILPSFLYRFGVSFSLEDTLGMHYFASEKFNLIQVVSYMFVHASFPNLSHILFNMFAVFMFGQILERLWGAKKFLYFYLITGLGAALVQQLFWYFEFHSVFSAMQQAIEFNDMELLLPYKKRLSRYFVFSGNLNMLSAEQLIRLKADLANSLVTVGASGAVFGLLLAFGWLFPEEKLFLFFLPIPIKARYFVIGYAVIELYLGVANKSGDTVAHFAHLGGMLFGLILMLYWRRKGKLYSYE